MQNGITGRNDILYEVPEEGAVLYKKYSANDRFKAEIDFIGFRAESSFYQEFSDHLGRCAIPFLKSSA